MIDENRILRYLPLVLLSLFFLSGIPRLGIGQDANPKTPEVKEAWVEEQIQRLDADTLRERAGAEKALLEAGPAVLPFLPPPELLPSVAVRQAVRRIRLRLEEAKARKSVKASTVTIRGTFPLEVLLKKIAEQTGNPIDAGELPQEMLAQEVSFNADELAFWEALARIGSKAGFQIQPAESPVAATSAVRLTPAESDRGTVTETTDGAFLIQAGKLKLRPRFGVEDQQLLRVPIRIAAEPRLRPLFLKIQGQDFTARTKEGGELTPFNPEASLELPLGEGGNETAFPMDFLVPKPFKEPAIELTGKATLTVAAGSEEIAFTNLPKAQGTARRRGGVTVTLNEIDFRADEENPNRQTAKIRVTVNYDTGGPAFESHRTWIFHNRVYLEDSQGKRIERNSNFHTALQTDGGVIVEYNFDDLADDSAEYQFVYVAPTLIINVPVEFEFENLPGERDA